MHVAQLTDLSRTFDDRGVVRVPGAFSRSQASAMADAIWRHVDRNTPCRRHDPATWDARPVSFKRLKQHAAFDHLITNPSVAGALDVIFGPRGWTPAKAGPQILMTFPNVPAWHLPHRLWHTDASFAPRTFPTFGVKLFACVEPVRPGGGGTLTIAGSHRLVERYRPTLPRDARAAMSSLWGGFMRQDPWLRELAREARGGDTSMMREVHDADGIPLEIVELTGEPGDVWITHLHTFHCVAPNALDTPRMMIAQAVSRNEPTPAS